MDGEGSIGPLEAHPEAAAILRDAGWAPHNSWLVYTSGTLVMGFDHAGGFHIKDWARIPPGHPQHSEDTPDTAVEAAQWLVARFPKPAPMADNPLSLESLAEPVAKEGADMAQPINIQVNPVFNVTGGNATSDAGAENEAHGEAGAETPSAGDQTTSDANDPGVAPAAPDILTDHARSIETASFAEPNADDNQSGPNETELTNETPVPESEAADEPAEETPGAVDSGDEGVAAGDDASAEERSAGGGLSVLAGDGSVGEGDSDRDYAFDADYEEIGNEVEQVEGADAQYPALDLGAEILEQQEEQSGGVAYFGDDFPTMKLKKLGRLAQIARERIAAHEGFTGWSDDDWLAVHNHVVSNLSEATGAYVGDKQEIYDRFTEMSAAKSHIDTIKHHRDQCVAYLESPDTPRAMVEQFDPESGWPE